MPAGDVVVEVDGADRVHRNVVVLSDLLDVTCGIALVTGHRGPDLDAAVPESSAPIFRR